LGHKDSLCSSSGSGCTRLGACMASADYANIKHSVRLSLGSKSSKIPTPWPSQLTLKGVSQTGDRSRPKHLQKKNPRRKNTFLAGGLFI
jgi:hypothetical protein